MVVSRNASLIQVPSKSLRVVEHKCSNGQPNVSLTLACAEDATGCVSTVDNEVFFVNFVTGEVFLLSD
eukprot:COSAG05_NODE_1346_length_5126_cov_12.771434_1_plen_68_part_00